MKILGLGKDEDELFGEKRKETVNVVQRKDRNLDEEQMREVTRYGKID